MLMAVKTNAVAKTVRKILVIRSKSAACNYCARRIVNAPGELSSTCGIQRRVLRGANKIVHLAHLVVRFSKNARSRDVRIVAFELAAAVNQDHIAFLQ